MRERPILSSGEWRSILPLSQFMQSPSSLQASQPIRHLLKHPNNGEGLTGVNSQVRILHLHASESKTVCSAECCKKSEGISVLQAAKHTVVPLLGDDEATPERYLAWRRILGSVNDGKILDSKN